MSIPGIFKRLARDGSGSTLVEFALLAPLLFAMLIGGLQIGLQMHSYNSIRSIAADTARYTIIEYQNDDLVNAEQIESRAVAIAVNPPYGLQIDSFTATVTNPASNIAGTTKFELQITYVPENMLEFFGIGTPTISVTRPIYVAS